MRAILRGNAARMGTGAATAAALVTAVLLPRPVGAQAQAQEPTTLHRVAGVEMAVVGDLKGFDLRLQSRKVSDGLDIVTVRLTRPQPQAPPRFTLKWPVPSHDVIGQWATGRHMTKTLRPDWAGSRFQPSMFAREAPVSCLFGSDDRNVLTFAVSDALNTVLTGSGIREEDGLIYNEVVFFSERHRELSDYAAEVRLDRRPLPYWTALKEVAEWWSGQPGYAPASVPDPARLPVYSTWYSYHQSVDAAALLKEMAAAVKMGFDSIIVDDGWQTLDTGRGYAFTGDWRPERIPDMKAFVDGVHALGAKVVLWYAVPFAGRNSQAAARFKDKSLRYEERLGAYVLDPRHPDVREYLIDTYRRALREWGIDGFKLDFIERFVADPTTVLEARDGRDFASVNEAADRLMTDILAELRKVKPDVMIEFRQPYVGPLIRKYGNMLRASDCPNSYVANRVKTADVRMLAGGTAVHADMIMWHYGEPVEIAALQLLNVLFSVPQVSVRLQEIPPDHRAMLEFYTGYWRRNREVLLDGEFEARWPAANYPLLAARRGGRQIVGVYGDVIVKLEGTRPESLDVVNAKNSKAVVLDAGSDLGIYRATIRDCQGKVVRSAPVRLGAGPVALEVPVSGLLTLEREAAPAAGAVTLTPDAAPNVAARRGTSPGRPDARLPYAPGKRPRFWSIATAETIMARYPDYRTAYWKDWTYVQGYVFHGFEMLYRATGDRRYLDYMRRYVDAFVDDQGRFHASRVDRTGQVQPDTLTNLDNLMTGTTIAALYEHTGDERYKTAARTFREVFDTYPRSDGQFWHGTGAPNMWIDGVFMGQMFALRYGQSVGDRAYCLDEAVRQITAHHRHCRKGDSGLYLHAWSEQPAKTTWADAATGLSPEVWSEGLGWYALVVAETLAALPQEHPRRAEVHGIFRGLAAALKRTQDAKTGGWFMVVDKGGRAGNWIDPSGTAMFVYALQRGIDLGLLEAREYARVAARGYRNLLSFVTINERGLVDVHGGGDGIVVKRDFEGYVGVNRVLNAKEAVGGFLWAAAIMEKAELARLGKRSPR